MTVGENHPKFRKVVLGESSAPRRVHQTSYIRIPDTVHLSCDTGVIALPCDTGIRKFVQTLYRDMSIDKTEKLLRKFKYDFERRHNQIVVDLGFSQKVSVDFSDPDRIRITDKLESWNYLTGTMEMSVKNAIRYTAVWGVLLIALYTYVWIRYQYVPLLLIFAVTLIWGVVWTLIYFKNAENLKSHLIRWNETS